MAPTSISAVVWWTFWSDYLSAVFQPWWNAAKVPVHLDHGGLSVGPGQASLDEDLETWTLHDPANPPSARQADRGGPRSRCCAPRSATTVASLTKTLGSDPTTWTWGAVHTRQFPSILGPAGARLRPARRGR